jgi:sulfur-oxidizing protein SoxZ
VAKALISVPRIAKKGEIVEIRILIQHVMETGFRPIPNGGFVPRDIINRVVCTYDGAVVFAAELYPAMSANPFLAFSTVATTTGAVTFRWIDDKGRSESDSAVMTVEA